MIQSLTPNFEQNFDPSISFKELRGEKTLEFLKYGTEIWKSKNLKFLTLPILADLKSWKLQTPNHPKFGPKLWSAKKKLLSMAWTLVLMFGKLKFLAFHSLMLSLGPPREKMLSMLQSFASNFGTLKVKTLLTIPSLWPSFRNLRTFLLRQTKVWCQVMEGQEQEALGHR